MSLHAEVAISAQGSKERLLFMYMGYFIMVSISTYTCWTLDW